MEEKKLNLGEIFDSLEEIEGENFGIAAIASILSLPDEEFNTVAPLILDELNRSLNNPNDRLLLTQSFNAEGITSDEAIANFKELVTQIDAFENEDLPQHKKDFIKQVIGLVINAIAENEHLVMSFDEF